MLHILILGEEENLDAFIRRLGSVRDEGVVLLGAREREIAQSEETAKTLLKTIAAAKFYLATKQGPLAALARAKGVRVIDRTDDLRELLVGHPQLQDALRLFSPHLWRQQLKSQLQRMGLINMPRLRIYSLVGLSALLFAFVVFRLLPSADIIVKPRQESVTQTVNIFLVQSGAQLPSSRVRAMPLHALTINESRTLTFDQVSKQFIGTPAIVDLKVQNGASESYSFRKGTRFQNQAGMVFRTLGEFTVPVSESVVIRAKADDVDAYNEIIGQRGNVPAGVIWEIPGLAEEQRKLITAINPRAASGGTTKFRNVLTAEDLEIATKRLEQELLATAKGYIDEEIQLLNAEDPERGIRLLRYSELTKLTYTGFVIPTNFIGQEVTSVPIEGSIIYTAHAYDASSILVFLQQELTDHVREGKQLLEQELSDDRLVVHVIDYEDDLSWIKLTVDLSGTEEYVIDALTKDGALFGKRVRDQVAGLETSEALRIVRNMPEVETARISIWPPWNRRLPNIPAHISVVHE